MEKEEIKHHIQELIQKGHIRPNSSPCGIPIVFVQKKDEPWRVCIEYGTLENITVWNWYPIPWIYDILNQLKWGKYFSKIDLKFGYY